MHAAGSRVRRRNKASGPQETGGRWSGGPSGPELDTGRESRRPDTGPSQGDVLDHVPQAAGAPGVYVQNGTNPPRAGEVSGVVTPLHRGADGSTARTPSQAVGSGLQPRPCHDGLHRALDGKVELKTPFYHPTDAELLSEDLRLPSCRDRLIHGPWGGGGEARAQDDLEVLTLCEVETCLDMRDLVWATAGSGDDRAD
ncbi:uncharacterized protein WM277_000681 isoform 1-T2 [Molossus nigricans]